LRESIGKEREIIKIDKIGFILQLYPISSI
jgi:hypothetical protein